MNVLTNAQMRAADEYTIVDKGVPSQTLMERAGKALANLAEEYLQTQGNSVLCVCGGGNNGGDGFICARILRVAGYDVEVVCVAERFSADGQRARESYLQTGGVLTAFPQKAYALVVDCLLGTGFCGALSTPYKRAIVQINEYKKGGAKVLSADIPSGVHGENGGVEEIAVCADCTLCLGEYKAGVFLGEGIDYAGKALRADIGIALPEERYATLIEKADVQSALPKRKRYSHKGSYGRAAIVAGSMEYTGAAYLATKACLRAGAGYTTLFTPKGVLSHYLLKMPEALLRPVGEGEYLTFDEEAFSTLLHYDAVAYGMGLGVRAAVAKGAAYLIENYEGKLVLDADALNALAKYGNVKEIFAKKKGDVLVTPHVKEFSRLTGESVESLLEKGLYAPLAFAQETGINVYLKNAVSLLTDGRDIFVNASGNAGLAKGGSGDVLSGVIVGLCAQGLSTLDGAKVGGYLVGNAAKIATQALGEYALLASDVVECLGRAFLEIER